MKSTHSLHCFLAETKQLYEWFSMSVHVSVRHTFSLCSRYLNIMKFSGIITIHKSDVHAKGQGQRSKVKVTEVITQFDHFGTVSPVWIHIWRWNDAQSLMGLERCPIVFQGHRSNFKVTREKITNFDPNLVFLDGNSSFNLQIVTKLCTKLEVDVSGL